jgi:uncharacterized membrane protein YccC
MTLWLATSISDRLAAVDPSFRRLRTATCTALSIALTLGAEWWFVHATGALQAKLPPRPSAVALAAVETQHHDIVVLAMVLGSVIALLCGILANGPTARGQLLTVGNIAVTATAFATVGLALGGYRDPALVLMVIIAAVGAYSRRYGQHAAVAGTVALIGYIYGYFVSGPLGVGAAGWTAVMVVIGAAAFVVIRALFFRPSTRRELVLSARTYGACVRRLFEIAMNPRQEPPRWPRTALEQWLVRVDEAALALEAQLLRFAQSSPVEGTEVDRLLEALFDEETAVIESVGSVRLLPAAAPDPLRQQLRCLPRALAAHNQDGTRDAIQTLRAELEDNSWETADDTARSNRVLALRRVDAADGLVQAGPSVVSRVVELAAKTGRTDAPAPPALASVAARRPSSTAVGGRDAMVSVRPSVPPYLRATAQMAVAMSIAIVAGYAMAGQRFYWAVISVLIVLLGTNTVAEQLRKGGERAVGVLVGVGVGTGLVDLVGHNSSWSAVIVVLAVWIGVYSIRGYHWGTMALAVTVSLSQVYLSLGQFSDGLLWERLAEVALGAAAAMVTVVVVLPVRTRRAVDQALAKTVESLSDLTDAAAGVASGELAPHNLRELGRRVDGDFQALTSAAAPLRVGSLTGSDDRLSRQLAAVSAARNNARGLIADVADVTAVTVGLNRGAFDVARKTLHRATGALAGHLRGQSDAGSYIRTAALFSEASRRPGSGHDRPRSKALVRDFVVIDNALADLAQASGVPTVRTPPPELVAGAWSS